MDGRDVILVYGNAGELHETAIKFTTPAPPTIKVVSGTGAIKQKVLSGSVLALQFNTIGQTVVEIGNNVLLYILGWSKIQLRVHPVTKLIDISVDRPNAYQFWVLHPPASSGALPQYSTENPIIVKGGYLIRSVSVSGGNLALLGDLNSTANFEIIAPAAQSKAVTFNGSPLSLKKTSYGTLTATRAASLPAVALPNLSALTWVGDFKASLNRVNSEN